MKNTHNISVKSENPIAAIVPHTDSKIKKKNKEESRTTSTSVDNIDKVKTEEEKILAREQILSDFRTGELKATKKVKGTMFTKTLFEQNDKESCLFKEEMWKKIIELDISRTEFIGSYIPKGWKSSTWKTCPSNRIYFH